MIVPTDEELKWLLRNFALGFIEHMRVTAPPVCVENLLIHPPPTYHDIFRKLARLSNLILKSPRSPELPLDQRRYFIACEISLLAVGSNHGHAMGLPELLVPRLTMAQDYFARVMLAPDSLVISYRAQRRDLRGFAETFLIPPGIAKIRWEDPIFN